MMGTSRNPVRAHSFELYAKTKVQLFATHAFLNSQEFSVVVILPELRAALSPPLRCPQRSDRAAEEAVRGRDAQLHPAIAHIGTLNDEEHGGKTN